MNDDEFKKNVDELDEQFKKWEAGIKDRDAKLGEKEYPGPRISRHEMLENDLKEMAELEKQNEILMQDLDNSDLKKDETLSRSYPLPRSFSRYKPEKPRYRKEKFFATVTIGALVALILLTMYYIPYPWPRPYQPEEFSITVSDGLSGEELDLHDFSYKLYGVNGDPCDFSGFVLIEISDGMHHLKYVDFDDYGYEFYFIEYNGTNEDDNKIYYTRWTRVQPDTSNSIVTFALPSSSKMSIMFMNLTSVDPSKGTGENITIIVGTNKSEPKCGYIPFFDYSREDFTNVEIMIIFKNAIGMTDFRVKDCDDNNIARHKINSTCIAFTIPALIATLTTYYGYWYVSGNSIIDLQLVYGTTILCSW